MTGMGGGEVRWDTELYLSAQVLSDRRRSRDTWRIPAHVGLSTHTKWRKIEQECGGRFYHLVKLS